MIQNSTPKVIGKIELPENVNNMGLKPKSNMHPKYEDFEYEDDWENERSFMRIESQNRELTEDEHIIYGL